nr:hypothetical protein CFP56_07761 [Quercus suber]
MAEAFRIIDDPSESFASRTAPAGAEPGHDEPLHVVASALHQPAFPGDHSGKHEHVNEISGRSPKVHLVWSARNLGYHTLGSLLLHFDMACLYRSDALEHPHQGTPGIVPNPTTVRAGLRTLNSGHSYLAIHVHG